MTTIDSITDDQIRNLRTEAGAAGDFEQVAICNAALAGSDDDRAECVAVIIAAEAMDGADDCAVCGKPWTQAAWEAAGCRCCV